MTQLQSRIRFGPFDANLATGELRKRGVRLKLHDQPFQVLAMLVARPGELITREEMRRRLWPTGTFVDFENGLNSAVNRLRDALGDSAEAPRFIETIPRKGYRFLVDVDYETESGGNTSNESVRPVPREPKTSNASNFWSNRNWNRVLAFTAIALMMIAVAPSVLRRTGASNSDGGEPAELKLVSAPLVTYGGGEQWLPAFSPDGSRVAYSWLGDDGWHVEVKLIGSDSRLRLTKKGAHFPPGPAWSPDGRQIVFVRADALDDRGIFVISAMGGPERKLHSLSAWRVPQRMVSWAPDGKWIAFSDEYDPEGVAKTKPGTRNAIYLISPETLETRRLTTPGEKDFGDAAPAFSPDGTTVAFVHTTAESRDQICTVPVSGGAPRVVVTEGLWTNGLAWTADGKSLLFDRSFSGGFSIWRVPASGGEIRRLDVSGSHENLLEPAIWRDHLAFEVHDQTTTVGLLRLTGPQPVLPEMPFASTRNERAARYSPKGDKISFISDRTGTDELWVADADGENPLQVSHFGLSLCDTAWSPDSKSVAVSLMIGKVFVISIETGATHLVFTAPAFTDEIASNLAYSRRDDSLYVVTQPGTGKKYELLKVPVKGGQPLKIVEGIVTNVAESPDGETLFYSLAESLTDRTSLGIWKTSTSGGREQFVVNAPGLWDLGERGIYVQTEKNTIERVAFSGKRLGSAAKLGEFPIRQPLSISPDGSTALVGYQVRRTLEIDAVKGLK